MHQTPTIFVKRRPDAPEGFFAAEAAGLAWLAEAESHGGAQVVDVIGVSNDALTLRRLESAPPTPAAARAFGAALAVTHDEGASAFGALPGDGSRYFFGPLDSPIALPTGTFDDFGTFYAEARLRPVATGLAWGDDDAALLERLCDALRDGAAERGSTPESPSRVHGDLWSGNLMWTPGGAVVIDPAACGHHRLADLAMLMMFGAPHLDEIVVGYESRHPLPDAWREEIPLHQLFGYLVHLRLFGASYLAPTREALRAAASWCGVRPH